MKNFLEMIKKRQTGQQSTAKPQGRPSTQVGLSEIGQPCKSISQPVGYAVKLSDMSDSGRFDAPSSQLSGCAVRSGGLVRSASFLRKKPEDFTLEERALRDEKLLFIKEVYDYSRRSGLAEWKACECIAHEAESFFPRLSEGGKKGASMLTYTNYRNWLTGSSNKVGIGRLADGSPDYGNADVLLRNYGCEKLLYGDPAFWESFKSMYLQTSAPPAAKIYRMLEFRWRLDYPGQLIPALYQVREYMRNRWPKRFLAYMRKGETYYLQHFRNFVERDPGTIRPNEAWVADTQDCDFMIRVDNPDGTFDVVRPKICVIMDIKSQHIISIQLISRRENDGKVSCTNEVIRNAFAMGCFYYGRPRIFLTDNGTDYCKAGFTDPVSFTPSVSQSKIYNHSIMLELDVMHLKAENYNARAKYVERFFHEMAEYSRSARGYVGNAPENRPATANVWAKKDNREFLMNEKAACDFIGFFVNLYHNKKCPDSKFLNGLSPVQAFAPNLRFNRPAMSLEEYKRAFLLPEGARILESRGPAVQFNNRRYVAIPAERQKAYFYDGKPVMIKSDILNSEHVYLFGLDGTYICEAATEAMMPYFVRLTCEEDQKLLAAKLEDIRAEKKYLDSMAMDETGNWHKLDPWTLFQMPREAFFGPAKLKLLDSMYSVKGETHNPKIHVLPEELRSGDIVSLQIEKSKDKVYTSISADESTAKAPDKPKSNPARKKKIDAAIRKALLAAPSDNSDSKNIPDENNIKKERKLNENFI